MSQNHLAAYERAVAIRHRVPGRLRVQVPAIGQAPRRARDVEAALRALPGVYGVRTNSACGSIVIHHRHQQGPSKGQIAAALAPIIGPLPPLAAPARKSQPIKRRGRRGGDPSTCVLCQLKLGLARLVLSDLWSCWRSDLETRARTGILAELPAPLARRSAAAAHPTWRERFSLAQQRLSRQVRQIFPFRSAAPLALPLLPPERPH